MDPAYMLMRIHLLGPRCLVWDRAAHLRFRKPGQGPLTATFRLDDTELVEIVQVGK